MRSVRFPPIPTLRTRDLVLRELVDSDAESYFRVCSDPEVMRTWGTSVHRTVEETRGLIAFLRTAHANQSMIRWAITLSATGELVGDVGFWRFVKERYRAEIGAKIARAHWSKGLVSQALTAVIRFGFEEMALHSVEANVDPTNVGAVRLVEKTGFLQEGLVREHSFVPETGKFVDTGLFSVVRSAWKPNPDFL